MNGRLAARSIFLTLVLTLMPTSVQAGEKVVLRTPGGRFLRAAEDGTVRVDSDFPTDGETFELVPCENGHLALKAGDGRFLVAEGRDARTLRADSPRVEPGDRETFLPISAGENRLAMKARNYRDFIVFDPAATQTAEPDDPDAPAAGETVEIYRVSQIPAAIRMTLAAVVRSLVIEELKDEQYEKIKTKKREKYIELPAPTIRDPGRKKRHRVLSMEDEYQIYAQLDGAPTIKILEMPYLKSYPQPGTGVLMFVVEAELPVRGLVRYKIPDLVSASTGFRTRVALSLVGEIRAKKSDDGVSLESPEVLRMRVELRSLDLANDVLNVLRRQIEDLLNDELRDRNARILQQANQSLAKAVAAREFRHPVLRYLAFP
ncbi:MAG TPA: hypothetical protein VMY42_24060 [Thermoguttaceae bacterium]|nr:hypothetical protein [Thermoguttaceae bacterium]